MMAQLRSDLAAAGVADERIHWEAFGVGAADARQRSWTRVGWSGGFGEGLVR